MKRLHTAGDIASKLGLTKPYINTVITLLQNGEKTLLRHVESGKIPISVAKEIANGTSEDLQRALASAYESGDLRGSKLAAARRLIRRRAVGKGQNVTLRTPQKPITSHDATLEYRHHIETQRALLKRANLVKERLALAIAACRQIFEDRNFITLLRAEGLTLISETLIERTRNE